MIPREGALKVYSNYFFEAGADGDGAGEDSAAASPLISVRCAAAAWLALRTSNAVTVAKPAPYSIG